MRSRIVAVTLLLASPVFAGGALAQAAQPSASDPLSVESIARGALQPRLPQGQPVQGAEGATISCEPPQWTHKMPDGRTATEAEMQAGQAAVRAYVAGGDTFQDCLVRARREAYARMTVQEYLALDQLELQMQAAMIRIANAFNEQIRLFRARTAPAAAPKN